MPDDLDLGPRERRPGADCLCHALTRVEDVEHLMERMAARVAAIEANDIKPVIDSSFPLEDIADAFRHQESQQHFGRQPMATTVH